VQSVENITFGFLFVLRDDQRSLSLSIIFAGIQKMRLIAKQSNRCIFSRLPRFLGEMFQHGSEFSP
jgi:hypothetical protein